MSPSQNTGTDEPSSASTWPRPSTSRRGKAAPVAPTTSPVTTASVIATSVSSIVAGNRARISVPTETPRLNQSSPKSRRAAPRRNRP